MKSAPLWPIVAAVVAVVGFGAYLQNSKATAEKPSSASFLRRLVFPAIVEQGTGNSERVFSIVYSGAKAPPLDQPFASCWLIYHPTTFPEKKKRPSALLPFTAKDEQGRSYVVENRCEGNECAVMVVGAYAETPKQITLTCKTNAPVQKEWVFTNLPKAKRVLKLANGQKEMARLFGIEHAFVKRTPEADRPLTSLHTNFKGTAPPGFQEQYDVRISRHSFGATTAEPWRSFSVPRHIGERIQEAEIEITHTANESGLEAIEIPANAKWPLKISLKRGDFSLVLSVNDRDGSPNLRLNLSATDKKSKSRLTSAWLKKPYISSERKRPKFRGGTESFGSLMMDADLLAILKANGGTLEISYNTWLDAPPRTFVVPVID